MRPTNVRDSLSFRVLVAIGIGILLGLLGGSQPYVLGLGNGDLGQLGMLVIRLLKALAIPLILFSILDAFIQSPIPARNAGRLAIICLVNVSVALTIGLSLINLFHPGDALHGQIEGLIAQLGEGDPTRPPSQAKASLAPLQNLASLVPANLLEPIISSNVVAVVLLAILFGAAIARLKHTTEDGKTTDLRVIEGFISGGYALLIQVLGWVIQAVPFAVLGLVAQAVGKAGLGIFSVMAGYLGFIALGLTLHGLIYYPLVAWLVSGLTPRRYLGTGADAVLTGFSTNSSLATVPVTLACLDKMGVSPSAARLAACAGTNLNNDGVTLYEVMTALFLAQAIGFDLDLGQQLVIAAASLMAGIGIAGIPEAGLIVLPLVLGAAGLPEAVVAAAIPLIAPVDWILARLRSGVNVLSDMLVAILLHVWDRRSAATTTEATD